MYKNYCISSLVLYGCSFWCSSPLGEALFLFAALAALLAGQGTAAVVLLPAEPNIAPLSKQQRELQQSILKITRGVAEEQNLVNSLLSLLEAPVCNIIHVATVLHCVGRFASLFVHPKWPDLARRAAAMVATETINVRTAISVVSVLAKTQTFDQNLLVHAIEEFIAANISALTCSTSMQLLSAVAGLPIELSQVIDVYFSGGKMAQMDIPVLASSGFRLTHETVHLLPNELPLAGIHHLITSSPELDRIVLSKVVCLSNLEKTPTVDIMAVATLKEDPCLWNELATRFCRLSGNFVKDVFAKRVPFPAHMCDLLQTSLELGAASKEASGIRFLHGLKLLVGSGVKPSETLLQLAKDEFPDFIDLLFYLSSIVDIQLPLNGAKTCEETLKVLCVAPALEIPKIEPGKISTHVGLVFLSRFECQQVADRIAGAVDRFVPQSVEDALNWLLVSRTMRIGDRLRKVKVALEAVSKGSTKGFTIGLKTAKKLIPLAKHEGVIEAFILSQIPFVASIRELIDILPLVDKDILVIEKLTTLIEANELNLEQIVQVLAILIHKPGPTERLDSLFTALQTWLVPRIPKLDAVQIAMITKTLEMFESSSSNEINTPSGVSTCSY